MQQHTVKAVRYLLQVIKGCCCIAADSSEIKSSSLRATASKGYFESASTLSSARALSSWQCVSMVDSEERSYTDHCSERTSDNPGSSGALISKMLTGQKDFTKQHMHWYCAPQATIGRK